MDPDRPGHREIHGVRNSKGLTEEWVEAFCRLGGVNEASRPAMLRMLAGVGADKGFAVFRQDGKAVACGLGVVEDEWLGLYNIVTDAAHRNREIDRRIAESLLLWGKDRGAAHGYLAVAADNEPARRLYAKLGFAEIHRYWYRVKRQ